jgi:hypothetical protein
MDVGVGVRDPTGAGQHDHRQVSADGAQDLILGNLPPPASTTTAERPSAKASTNSNSSEVSPRSPGAKASSFPRLPSSRTHK